MSPIEVYTARFGAGYKWYATVTVMIATTATTACATIVNVAMPDIMGAFGLGQDQVQWLATGFLAAMTACMLLTDWLISRLGYRVAFTAALVICIGGSLLGASAVNDGEIILARVLQGVAAGLVQPITMVVLSQVFPVEQRGKAMSIYGIGVVLAPALGPTLGGFLVDQYTWRDVFLAIIPVCVIAIVATAIFLPGRDSRPQYRTPRPFDGIGFLLLIVFLIALLSALSNGQREGWNSSLILTLFAAAIVSGCAFVGWELTSANPLLSIRVFANFQFTASCVVALALGVGIYGSTYIVPLFVQLVQGYTPTRSGLLLMPSGFVLALVFPIAGYLADRTPPWLPVALGLTIFGISNALCSGADVDTPFWMLGWWLVLGRIGLGLITPALNAGALRALPPELLAQGSGSLNFVRQLGGALGINLLSVLVDMRMAFHGDALAQEMTPATSAAAAAIRQLIILMSHWGNPFGTHLPTGVPPAAMTYLESILVPKAQMLAYQDGFYAVAIAFFLAILPALFMRPKAPGRRHRKPAPSPEATTAAP
ncbi:MAG: DHA2 family efflux MFS transporter permease subunit [Alphaproteobacteria bacterium]|nr:DHA2 family efflux MFS transporter permease subunit [Alphaproteobacteria bacterium]